MGDRRIKLSHAQRGEIARARKCGRGAEDLAAEYGVSVDTVRRVCRAAGVRPARRKRAAPRLGRQDVDRMRALLRGGAHPLDVARALGLSIARVRREQKTMSRTREGKPDEKKRPVRRG